MGDFLKEIPQNPRFEASRRQDHQQAEENAQEHVEEHVGEHFQKIDRHGGQNRSGENHQGDGQDISQRRQQESR